MVLLEVLENGSIGYGGKLIPPGGTFLCDPKYVADIVARNLAKVVGETTPELPVVSPVEPPGMSEASKAEERKNLFDELVNLGITPAAKTNTKTLRGLAQRARMEARQ